VIRSAAIVTHDSGDTDENTRRLPAIAKIVRRNSEQQMLGHILSIDSANRREHRNASMIVARMDFREALVTCRADFLGDPRAKQWRS